MKVLGSILGAISGLAIAIVLIIAIVSFGPFLIIWSLNTLFPILSIPYTVKTLSAALVLILFWLIPLKK